MNSFKSVHWFRRYFANRQAIIETWVKNVSISAAELFVNVGYYTK